MLQILITFVANFKQINKMTLKTICTHCGKKQTSSTHSIFTLNYVQCKFCNKQGELRELQLNRLNKNNHA